MFKAILAGAQTVTFKKLKMTFTLQEKEIFTSLSAARSLLEQKKHRPLLLLEDSALEDFTGTECVCERERVSESILQQLQPQLCFCLRVAN